jgi:hypothetical protein
VTGVSERAARVSHAPAFAPKAFGASAVALAEAETERAGEAARESVSGSSAFAKARADIAESFAEACRGAKPLGYD